MRKFKKLIITFTLIICFLFSIIPLSYTNLYADSNIDKYTNVLEDLKKDTNFNEYSYNQNPNDYSLQVIQIAESNKLELFIYVYQPSGATKNLMATSINIATSFNENLNYINYELIQLNKVGVFYKYLVKELIVSAIDTREYEISSIYRYFDETMDETLDDDNENIIDEVNYNVSKHWIITNDNVICQDIETITITDKYVGFVRYEDGYTGNLGTGLSWYTPGCDSHFIAFSTNRQLDKLMEADVYYTSQKYSYSKTSQLGFTLSESETFGRRIVKYSYLNYLDRTEVSIPHGFFGPSYTYSWDRISSVEDFIDGENREFVYNHGIFDVKVSVNLTNEGLQDLQNKEWVLRFAETDYVNTNINNMGSNIIRKEHTIIGDVSILRLKFETNSVVYNLGVIDNKQTGDGIPDNYTSTSVSLSDWFKNLLSILLLILLFIILYPVLPFVFKVTFWIISLPIKLIQYIFKNIQNKNNKKKK